MSDRCGGVDQAHGRLTSLVSSAGGAPRRIVVFTAPRIRVWARIGLSQLGDARSTRGRTISRNAVALLFTGSELTVAYNADNEEAEVEDDDERAFIPDVFAYNSTVRALRARLRLQGFDPDEVHEVALTYLTDVRADPEHVTRSTENENRYPTTQSLIDAVTRWARERYWTHVAQDPVTKYLDEVWRDLLESFDDPRFAISLLMRGARSNTAVRLDLSDCLMGGWLEADERPHLTARARLASRTGSSGSAIVVTEGSTDAAYLSRALHIGAPAVVHQCAFLDFDTTSAAGGVDQVVKLTRALAAAGVVNRVIAVLDNDAVGNQAAEMLRRSSLPSHFAIVVLPDVKYANHYPTIGPNGVSHGDVNGRAVTIEMCFGEAVLRAGGNGGLPPVRWGAPVGASKVYQGTIDFKRDIQEKLRTALSVDEPIDALEPGVADGCRVLSHLLLSAASNIRPMMTSEFSPLLAERVRHE